MSQNKLQPPVYMGRFTDKASMLTAWDDLTPAVLAEVDVLAAWYEYECYEGDAVIIARRKSDGVLVEAHDSHCSCRGLEWRGWEETSREAILMRRYDVGLMSILRTVLA